MADVAAAINTNKKNAKPNRFPKVIDSKTAGKIPKIKPGPAVGVYPNANTTGKIANPERTATRVSKPATINELVIKFVFFFK